MKMAIIGSGPLAIKASEHFFLFGAEITLFANDSIQLNLNENISIKNAEVLRIHKRFLSFSETIENRSRLHDLFRVVYAVNPVSNILNQVESNPEMFSKLGEKVLESLKFPVESFEDFDLVIEVAPYESNANPMGPSLSYAINELNLSKNSSIYYELKSFKNINLEKVNNLAIVGSNKSVEEIFITLKNWHNQNNFKKIFWIFESNLKKLNLESPLKELLNYYEEEYNKEILNYEKLLFSWRELEDYIQAKIEKPILPNRKIEIFSCCNVTAIDQLIDQEGLFITIESPDYREDFKAENELKTISVDAIVVANGYQKNTKSNGLREDEVGYFYLVENNGDQNLQLLKNIEMQILNYFTKVESND